MRNNTKKGKTEIFLEGFNKKYVSFIAYIDSRYSIINELKDAVIARTMEDFEKQVRFGEGFYYSIEDLETLVETFSKNTYDEFNDFEYNQKFVLNTFLHILLIITPKDELASKAKKYAYDIQKSGDEYLLNLYSNIINTM